MDTSFTDMNCQFCHERPGHVIADAFLCDVCDKITDPDVMLFYSEQNKADQASLTARLGAAEKHVEVIRGLREHDRQQIDALTTELAQARAERDEAVKLSDFAKDGYDNMRFLKVLWENECGFYRAQSVSRLHEIDLGRRTIRALVVACRAMDVAGFMKMGHDRWYAIVRQWVRDIERIRSEDAKQAKQSGQQAGE